MRKAESVLSNLEDDWAELPDCWLDSDLDNSTSPDYTIDQYREILERPFQNSKLFWQELIK